MRTRLVPYVPFGAAKGVLPDALESQVVTPLGELSTASVHYHRSGVGAVSLDGVTELGFEYWNGTGWVEPPSCRFLSMRGSFDHLEATPTRNYSLIGIGWMLRQAKVWEASGLPVDADGKVQFLSANAGKIMGTLIQNAKGRGWGAGIAVDFSATADSAGKAWAKQLTIAYDLDVDLETILSNLYQQGVCDFRWEGRTLRIFNPDTAMGRDLTTGANPVRLVVADGQTAAPEDWTNEDLLTHAMVLGEEGARWEFGNGAVTPLGRLESVITQGGVSDQGTASLLAEPGLVAGSQTRVSYTREFVVTDKQVTPFKDYLPGDWVSGQRGPGFERLRTYSLSLTVNAAGVKGHAVLGDRLEDLLTKLAKRTKGITGGASAGGSGVKPAPEGPDKRVPTAPVGLVVAADAYIDDAGNARGQVSLSWAHDGKATTGTVMDIDRHAVQYRVNETGAEWQGLTETPEKSLDYSPLAVFKADGVTPQEYAFRVRAVARNNAMSAWSAQVAVVMEDDATPPPVPQFLPADVTTWLRTVTVRSQGNGLVGSTVTVMPRDFDYFNVYQGTSPTGPWKLVGSFRVNELWQSDTMPTATVWYALTSVDRSENESAMSVVQSVTPTANVDLSLITDKLDAAQVEITNAGKIILESGQELDSKLTENTTALTTAKSDIADAKYTLDVTFPARFDAVDVDIDAAQAAAVAAATADAAAQVAVVAAQTEAAQSDATAALSAAEMAQAAADGAIHTYYQSTEPTGLGPDDVGDMWYDADDDTAHRWTGTAFKLIQDSGVSAALAAAQDAQATADGKITSFYRPGIPSAGQLGDLWFDTDDGNKPYYCTQSTPVTWAPIRDAEILETEARAAADAKAKADAVLAVAVAAQAAADEAVFYQSEPPDGGTPGKSLWVDSDNGKTYIRVGAA